MTTQDGKAMEGMGSTDLSKTIDRVVLVVVALFAWPFLSEIKCALGLLSKAPELYPMSVVWFVLTYDMLMLTTFLLLLLPGYFFRLRPTTGDIWLALGIATFTVMALVLHALGLHDAPNGLLPPRLLSGKWVTMVVCLTIAGLVTGGAFLRAWRRPVSRRRWAGYALVACHLAVCISHVIAMNGLRQLGAL